MWPGFSKWTKRNINLADLKVSDKRWDDLDVALAEAVFKVVNNSLLKEILYYQETQANGGRLMHGRAALWYVYRRYALSAAATRAIDFQSLMNLKFSGDLQGFLHAWDACLLAISPVPGPELLYALLEPKLRDCKQLGPAFAYLDGAETLPNAEQLAFNYNAARREVKHWRRDKTK